jgi:excisionase family DNA binding protein
LLTPAEAARMLGVERDYIYRHAAAGDFPVVRLGSSQRPRLRVDVADLRAWLSSNRSEAA